MLKGVSETLYIPLYGRASARKYGNIIEDPMAERIAGNRGMILTKIPAAVSWTYIWPYGQPRSTAWSQVF